MAQTSKGLNRGMKITLLALMIMLVFSSAISVIYAKHKTRQYFAELQNLQREAEDLHVEWSQLLVEQGTWASDARVEKVARQHLNMVLPLPQEVMVIEK